MQCKMLLTFILIHLLINICSVCSIPTEAVHQEDTFKDCEPIEGSACKGLGYNFTLFPNIFKHETQLKAMRELQTYYPLISVQCSPLLREFLCTLYIPPCTHQGFHLPPCRSLCQQVQTGCAELQKFPEKFDCDNFPGDHELLCLSAHSNIKYYDPEKWPEKDELESTSDDKSRRDAETTDWPVDNDTFVHCSNDSECLVTGSVCRGGECVCRYPRAWGPLGCQYSQILGGSCRSTSDCTTVTPNAICFNSICTCKTPLTSYRNLSCIHGSEVGSLCYNDAQCRAVNTYSFCRYLVAQVVGTCACDPDQFVNTEAKCVPRLGGRCEKGFCSRELGKATCKRKKRGDFRCRCQKRAQEIRGVCIGFTDSGDWDDYY